ncbi:hypothetical protein PG999_011836 [Apiospora kogelbergensis]|uniref:Amidoligase enzyme n=1 Tax=Apiospora kogelbergensis TaxID=1337665 RepID=A0AAW0QFF3_9PEZI
MDDSTVRGTLGFEFEFFPTVLCQWTLNEVQAQAQSPDFISKITGQESAMQLEQLFPGCLVVATGQSLEKHAYIVRELLEHLRQKGLHVNDTDANLMPKVPSDPALSEQVSPYAMNATDEKYHRWSVTEDITVSSRGTFDPFDPRHTRDTYLENEIQGSHGVEIITPAITDTPGDYQEVVKVFNLLRGLFFLHVNDTCGLHVHVAFGKHVITMPPLRKIACLLFALDPFLATIHPDHRTNNNASCPSIRKLSNVAKGWKFADAVNDLNRSRMGADDEWDPVYAQTATNMGDSMLEYVAIPDAVAEIQACKKSEEVAWLLHCGFRANYNFNGFLDGTLNPTVEFREHAATTDAGRVVAWGRFCVALLRYAAFDMSDEDLKEIVMDCNEAETESEPQRKAKLWQLLDFMNLQDNAFDLNVPRPRT